MTSGEKGNSGGFITTSKRTRNRGPELVEDVRHCCKIAFRCGWGIAGVFHQLHFALFDGEERTKYKVSQFLEASLMTTASNIIFVPT